MSFWSPSPDLTEGRMEAEIELHLSRIQDRETREERELDEEQAAIQERRLAEERAAVQRRTMGDRRAHREHQASAADDARSARQRTFENARRRAQEEYRRKIEEEEAARLRRVEYERAQEVHTREQLATEPPPTVSPMIFSYRWCRNRIRNFWQEPSPGARAVTTLFGIAAIWTAVSYAYQFVFGLFFYVTAYYQAYHGYDFAMNGCYRAMMSSNTFWTWNQSHHSWFQLQQCRAYTDALDRDGQLSPLGQAIATLITDPFGASPGIYMITLGLVVYFILPRIGRRLRALSTYVWHADRPFWGKMIYLCLLTSLVFLMANDLGALAFLVGLGFSSVILFYVVVDAFFVRRFRTAWEAASGNLLAGPVIAILSWSWGTIWSFWMSWKDPVLPAGNSHCIHGDPCFCFVERDRLIEESSRDNEELRNQLQTLQASLDAEKQLLANANVNLELVTDERDRCEARNRGALMHSPGHWHLTRHDDARSRHWEQRFMERDSEYLRLANEKWEQEKACKKEIERLQKAVNYTVGAGLDRENAIKELYEAKATIRTLERERNALSLTGMNLRQELAKEKESRSEKCQNEAGCQRRIQELEENYDRVMAHMREDQSLVTEACVALGMDRKEAEHMQLRSYLADVTIQLAKLYSMGVRGADTTDLQVEIMRREVARESTYKNRLERELERLGGNIMDVRIGLDTTRPQDWKVDFMTYEQNLLRVFPIYRRLWQAIIDMTEVFGREGFVLPPWNSQPARNDMSSHVLAFPPPEAAMQLVKANEVTNPHIESLEVLVEKLVVAECQRLYNRGLQLLSFLDSNMTVHANISGIQGVNAILNEVLHEVLDTAPALLRNHPTERALSPRKQKKFEIYSAMQTAIASLLMQIIANKRMPPDWLSTDYYDDLFSKPYDTPENLAMNLSNHELAILAKRIQQLVTFTEEYQLPGTRAGPPRAALQHDPAYMKRWDNLVIARTFAKLTISHWNVHKSQKELLVTDEAGRQLVRFEPNPQLLPLNVEKFRVAVGLNPLKKQDTRWPDDWKAKMVNDPSSGPLIVFEPPAPPDKTLKAIEYPGYGTPDSGNKSDYTQVALVGTSKEIERKKLQSEWREHQERCEQLYNHVVAYGIKNHIPRLAIVNLRANADPKSMKRDIEAFKEAENQYVHALTGGTDKFAVPPMRKKGGKMHPFN